MELKRYIARQLPPSPTKRRAAGSRSPFRTLCRSPRGRPTLPPITPMLVNTPSDLNFFANSLSNGVLTTPSNAGVYAYGSATRFRQIAIKPATTGLTSSSMDCRRSRRWPTMTVGSSRPRTAALSIPASVLLANDTDPNGLPLSITGVSNPSHGTVTYNSSTQAINFVPAANYVGPAALLTPLATD